MIIGRRTVRWVVAAFVLAALLGVAALIVPSVPMVMRHGELMEVAPHVDADVDPRFAHWISAIKSHDFDAARHLIDDGFSVDAISDTGEPASFIAIGSGDVAALRWLLDQGANLEGGWQVRGEVVLRLLQHAILRGCDECVMVLLDRGANVRPPLNAPRSLLHDAFGECASDEVIAALIDAGADREPVATDGSTLLYSAGCERAFTLGLEWGLDPNAVCRNGSVPLHSAALRGCLASVKLLIEAGARIDVRGPGNNLPLHYIDRGGRGRSEEWLQSAERAELVRLLTPDRMRPRDGQATSPRASP